MLAATLLLLALAGLCLGDSSPNEFIYPGPSGPSTNYRANLVLPLGTSQVIQWTTNVTNTYTLVLWQQRPDTEAATQLTALTRGTSVAGQINSYTWTTQLYSSSLDYSPIYFFWLTLGNGPQSITSHYFNITNAAISTSSTSSTPSPTSTSSAAVASSSATTTQPGILSSITGSISSTLSSTATAAPQTAGGVDTKTLGIGLGVGLGLGIPAILALSIFLILRFMKRGRQSGLYTGPTPQQRPYSDHPDAGQAPWAAAPMAAKYPPSQIQPMHTQSTANIYEAPGVDPGWGPQGRYEAAVSPRQEHAGPYEMGAKTPYPK